jgi:methylmalonyl-CoA mutase N-terminal domain/subunit
MYRERLWTMRQYAGFGSAEDTNARFRYLLSQGQTALSVAFDLPTQLGYDSSHELASNEVGRVGVAIDTADDMAAVFDGLPL